MITFREARREDVPAIVGLLADDLLGVGRETAPLETYQAAFDQIAAAPGMLLIVGEIDGRVIGTYQLAILPGLSLGGTTRGLIEAVRVASDWRSQGFGALLMADAEARARAAGATLLQLTTHQSRERVHRFYERLGFTASHIGYKRALTPQE
ncbi:GNAT family N-acetyltransferase [Cereibacter sphaeroides]|uniref:GNAT family N-acetyltransferase n=1 Tax=Cereibacter sphaeroides TaxID=1063 RepID=UPI001F2FA6FD|nr:GNAT family N-acetyltransferase [Cereibacter sphaeroides]MCE6950736.1 GNAT family N-acetyltransferase [Cereibacter sphaeroides]